MSNLLDRSSLVLTPTAYNNGEALCIKPDDASGDFQFSRNSAATRVNAQGLVENVQILSSNLVQNGSFSEEGVQEVSNGSFSQEGVQLVTNGTFDSNIDFWNKGGGNFNPLSWDNGKIKVTNDVAQLNSARQTIATEIGKTYKISADVDSTNGITPRLASSNPTTAVIGTLGTIETLTYTFTATSTSSQIELFNWQNTIDKYNLWDNVSVREVGQNWDTFGTIDANNTVSFANNELTLRNDGSGSGVKQNALTIGKTYKVVINVTDIVGNGFKVDMGNLQNITTTGTKTFYLTATTASLLLYRNSTSPQAVNGATITNISVKEVGQNWDFVGDFEIGNNQSLITNASQYSQITQQSGSTFLTANRLYKLSADIPTLSISNALAYRVTGGAVTPISTSQVVNGKFETEFIMPSNGYLWFQTTGSYTGLNASITNISVIEITDDTNLPRINYEGFSYQDVLGSEEVVNGGFDNGGANWSNIGGFATFENSSVIFENNAKIYQNVVNDLSKEYNIEIEFSSISGNGIQLLVGNGNSFVSYSVSDIINNGNKINIAKESFIGSGILFIYSQNSSTSATITNVSVKEYLGQEVVPESGCGSWLFEPQSTNLLPYSEDFSQWGKANYTVQSNVAVSPSGNFDASFVTNPSGGGGLIKQVVNVTASTAYTFSFYAKRGTASDAKYSVYDNTNGGDIIPSTSYYSQINSDTFTRIKVSFTAPVGCTSLAVYVLRDNLSVGNTIVWGAMLEQNSFSTSYIPTSGSQVTRNQDVCTNGGSLASINSTSGTLYAEIAALNQTANVSQYITISDGTYNNRASILFSNGSTNSIRTFLRVGGVPQIDVSNAVSDVTDFNKIAFSYKENNFKIYLNGVLVSTDTSGSVWSADTITKLSFSEINTTGGAFFGKTKALAVWKEALSDQELADLTYPTPTFPTFTLDFNTIAEQFTFARGSEATYVDAQGLIQSTASNNAPRLDYSTGAEAFLLEPQSTNLLPYSEDFSQWSSSGDVTVESGYLAPDGTNNAYKVSGTTSALTLSAGLTTTTTRSIYARTVSGTGNAQLLTHNSNTNNLFTITEQWQRFDLNTANATGVNFFYAVDFRGSGTLSEVILWGANATNDQDYATSYIPSNGSQVTRNQETCINATPEINSEEGVLYFEGSALVDATIQRWISLGSGGNANRVSILFNAPSRISCSVRASSSAVYDANFNIGSQTNHTKAAIRYKNNDYSFFVNGVKVNSQLSGTLSFNSPLSELAFDSADGGSKFFGNTKDVQVYTKALSDAELIKLTTI